MADKSRDKKSKYEDLERTLDPHRADEQKAAAREASDRLRSHGVEVKAGDTPEELADLLDAVEWFEKKVESHGGDLMVDDLKSSQPDDTHFVLPRRKTGEKVRDYIGRIQEATAKLRKHPRHTD
jgi:hypothetical protein